MPATHRAWPLRQDASGGLAQVEHGELVEVRQCVAVIKATPLGARPLAPQIGVEDPTFANGVDADALEQTLEEQEDRAIVTVTVGPVDQTGEQAVQIAVGLATGEPLIDPDVI